MAEGETVQSATSQGVDRSFNFCTCVAVE